MGSLLDQQ